MRIFTTPILIATISVNFTFISRAVNTNFRTVITKTSFVYTFSAFSNSIKCIIY
jgi:hypothetical protein